MKGQKKQRGSTSSASGKPVEEQPEVSVEEQPEVSVEEQPEVTVEEQPEVSSDLPGWIAALHKHWIAGKDWVLISGYFGGTVGDGMLRVYLDPVLWQAIDVPRDAIIHRERTLEDTIRVWVDRDQWSECLYRQRF